MREAKTNDHWRTLYKRSYPYSPVEILINGIEGVEETCIKFPHGICAICGPNGTGKTTLLSAIHNAINDNKNFHSNNRTINFNYITECNFNNQNYIYSNLSQDNPPIEDICIFINIPDQAVQSLTYFNKQNTHEQLDGIDPYDIPQDSVDATSKIIGKDYTSIKQYEIETENGSSIPYFHATTSNLEYYTESMGLGELSVINTIFRIHEAPNGKILIIEEPENFLSPKSQQIFIDHLAYIASTKGIYIILTTHSPYILSKIEDDNIRIVNNPNNITSISPCLSPNEALYSLGLRKHKTGIIFVEDSAAKDFLIAAHRKFYTTSKMYHTDIIIKDGWSNIIDILKKISSNEHSLSFIGAIDGDQRLNTQCDRKDVVFLPTDLPPDVLIYNFSKTIGFSESLSTVIPADSQLIQRAISNNQGIDFHDWAHHISTELSIPISNLREAIFTLWIGNCDENFSQAETFIKALNSLINHPR